LLANVDNSNGEVTIVLRRKPLEILWMHQKTKRGAEMLELL
ncbi:unnamed protein product, partial [marine sediment metagenome]